LDFQEFLFIPRVQQPFLKKVESGAVFYQELKRDLLEKGLAVAVGDEGGFPPGGIDNLQVLDLLREVFGRLNLTAGEEAALGLDAAASQFHVNGFYQLKFPAKKVDSQKLIDLYVSLAKDYPLVYLEDPLDEDDPCWEDLSGRLEKKVEIVGDDLTVTNEARLRSILPRKIIQGIVIKPNQVGTITETLATVEAAKKAGLALTVAHRAGETESSFIADFAVGIGAKYIKFGAPARGERVAKYDRLLEIEKEVTSG
jgi:enolase